MLTAHAQLAARTKLHAKLSRLCGQIAEGLCNCCVRLDRRRRGRQQPKTESCIHGPVAILTLLYSFHDKGDHHDDDDDNECKSAKMASSHLGLHIAQNLVEKE